MTRKPGFDNDRYLARQTEPILQRAETFHNKLYLEFGGKLLYDYHAELRGREVHLTHIPTPGDEAGLRRLGVNLTSDPNFSSKNLFVH